METLLGLGVFRFFLLALTWWSPVILVLRSKKTSGGEKLVGILLIFFFPVQPAGCARQQNRCKFAPMLVP